MASLTVVLSSREELCFRSHLPRFPRFDEPSLTCTMWRAWAYVSATFLAWSLCHGSECPSDSAQTQPWPMSLKVYPCESECPANRDTCCEACDMDNQPSSYQFAVCQGCSEDKGISTHDFYCEHIVQRWPGDGWQRIETQTLTFMTDTG